MRFLIGSLFGTKRELLTSMLERGMVMVHLDARCEGVSVPSAYAQDGHLRLNLSHNFGLDDFAVGEDAVSASLSFRGERFPCVLPWKAVFAITSHVEPVGYLWPDDLPAELANQLGAGAQPGPPGRPKLRVVSARESSAAEEVMEAPLPSADLAPDALDGRRVHLRVVK